MLKSAESAGILLTQPLMGAAIPE